MNMATLSKTHRPWLAPTALRRAFFTTFCAIAVGRASSAVAQSTNLPDDLPIWIEADHVLVAPDLVRVLLNVRFGFGVSEFYNYVLTVSLTDHDWAITHADSLGPLRKVNADDTRPQDAIGPVPVFPLSGHEEFIRSWQARIRRDGILVNYPYSRATISSEAFQLEEVEETWKWIYKGPLPRDEGPFPRDMKTLDGGSLLVWRTAKGSRRVFDFDNYVGLKDEWLLRRLDDEAWPFGRFERADPPAARNDERLTDGEISLTQDRRFLVFDPRYYSKTFRLTKMGEPFLRKDWFVMCERDSDELRAVRRTIDSERSFSTHFFSMNGNLGVIDCVKQDREIIKEDGTTDSPTDLVVGIPATGHVRKWEEASTVGAWFWEPFAFDDERDVLYGVCRISRIVGGQLLGYTKLRVIAWELETDRRRHVDIDVGKLWLEAFKEQAAKRPAEDAKK